MVFLAYRPLIYLLPYILVQTWIFFRCPFTIYRPAKCAAVSYKLCVYNFFNFQSFSHVDIASFISESYFKLNSSCSHFEKQKACTCAYS